MTEQEGTSPSAGDRAEAQPPVLPSATVNEVDQAPATTADPTTFEEMGLRPELMRSIVDMGFALPMEVQRRTFRKAMAGCDLLVQSRTGSGKTAAFGIPFAQGLIDAQVGRVQALVLCPTRELALQVANECERIGVHSELKVAPIYGGAPMGKQIEQLKGGAQIVAGTPGRVLDHLRRGTLKLDGLRILVLDECDEMLSMGFYEEISDILKHCPTDRQTMLFSATIPDEIERISARHMRSPEKITLAGDLQSAQSIAHYYYMVSGMGRTRDLVSVLRVEKPDSAIIFCNTREDTNVVAEYLRSKGMDAEAISSDLTQKDRERVMGRMRAANLQYLVATDIAARGIDISDLSHVINYTFPESAEVYVHRTGRTGRAGKTGIAISLISPRELGNFYYLKLTYKIRPEEKHLPTEEEIATRRDGERIAQLLAEFGGRAPGEEWRRLARRALATDGGEAMVASLIERWFHRITEAAQEASPAIAPPALVEEVGSDAPRSDARPPARAPRGRGQRSHQTPRASMVEAAEPSPRPKMDRPASVPTPSVPVPVSVPESDADAAPAVAASPRAPTIDRHGRERRRRPKGSLGGSARSVDDARSDDTDAGSSSAVGEASAAGASVELMPSSAAAPHATPDAARSTEGRRRGRDGQRGGRGVDEKRARSPRDEASAAMKQAPTAQRGLRQRPPARPLTGAPTIEANDGREFWEVWAEDHQEPGAATVSTGDAPVAAHVGEVSPAVREAASPPGVAPGPGEARLFLSLGRRDGLSSEEIEAWVVAHNVAIKHFDVRNSHTYLIVDDAGADAIVAGLAGTAHGERRLVCERARR